MPLGDFEREVLRLLAVNRNPDSYVAGATVLNQSAGSSRTSKDADVFHDTVGSLSQSANHASAEFPKLTRHFGSAKGAWPRIVEE